VLDLSSAGFAAATPPEFSLAPGAVLDSFELLIDEQPVWTGAAVVVHGNPERVGGRFTSGLLDLQHLHLGATLDGRLALNRECARRLPAEWRAAVGDLTQLLEGARREIEELERTQLHEFQRASLEKSKLFDGFRARWERAFYETVSDLFEMSRGFDDPTAALGRFYAVSMILPFTIASPFHRRAHEKPLGYAGDHRMMEMCFSEPAGDGLFGGFIDAVIKSSTLVRAVVARELVMRQAVHDAIEAPGNGPVRVLALAAGPAIELRRLLAELGPLRRPVELILLDQDRSAHEVAHRQLTRILLEQHRGTLPVEVRCLHFSVRQLLKPQTDDDQRVVGEMLAGLDLIYSAGLYDYLSQPVAASLTKLLYGRLRPGGRLLIGNLVESPDSTWVLDYILDWRLLYRTAETLLALANGLGPEPAEARILSDSTEHCLFLDVTRSKA
jgi:extracellular factor (EF) 3-hydroxypalmitic acid methyl ester biosynthesis protein